MQVAIGPEFFSKAINDYNNWQWAWIREINQNSMDAGSGSIDYVVSLNDQGNTLVEVTNDGSPMTRDILVNKLLSLGSSGKNCEGSVGGFGKAKELLLFTHLSWRVHTANYVAEGSGGSYELDEHAEFLDGTKTTVVMKGDVRSSLKHQFNEFCFYAQWKGVFSYNGEECYANMRKGTPRRHLGFGQVYTNKSTEYKLVVRINGQPMFIQSCGLDRCVVLELDGASIDVLTANRDGLAWQYRQELSTFVTEISVDKRSALKPRQERYIHYAGQKISHSKVSATTSTIMGNTATTTATVPDSDATDGETIIAERPILTSIVQGGYDGGHAENGESVATLTRPSAKAPSHGSAPHVEYVDVAINEEFVIKNETDLVVPEYYKPDSEEFSTYSKKLARIWGRLMLQLHRTFEHEASFAIGFIFSDDTVAEYEEGDYGKIYYLAAAEVVEQRGTYSKSWKKRFKLTDRNRMLSLALHEFVHGLGYDIHDEEYAGKLTDMLSKVLDRRKDFNWCWK